MDIPTKNTPIIQYITRKLRYAAHFKCFKLPVKSYDLYIYFIYFDIGEFAQ
jgi:hypothetical protein